MNSLRSAKYRSAGVQLIKQLICLAMVLIVILPIVLTLFASLKTKGQQGV